MLQPIDHILSQKQRILNLHQSTELACIVLQVKGAICQIAFDKRMHSAYTDVLNAQVVVSAPSYLDLVTVQGTALRVVEVNHV